MLINILSIALDTEIRPKPDLGGAVLPGAFVVASDNQFLCLS